jgi:hypothetical protein
MIDTESSPEKAYIKGSPVSSKETESDPRTFPWKERLYKIPYVLYNLGVSFVTIFSCVSVSGVYPGNFSGEDLSNRLKVLKILLVFLGSLLELPWPSWLVFVSFN